MITPEQARLFGIDQRVASTLVTQAVMDEQAKKLGLSVPDDLVARSILQEPGFRGSDGQFNRALFEQVLRNNGAHGGRLRAGSAGLDGANPAG